MDSKFNNIFNEQPPVTRQEMEAYLSGRLSPSEMHNIELKLEGHAISAEALEGFQNHPEAINGLDEINTNIQAKLQRHKAWTVNHTLIAAGIAGILVLSGGYFLNNSVQPETFLAEETPDKSTTIPPSQAHFVISEPIVITKEIEIELEEAHELPAEQQITAEFIELHQPVTIESDGVLNDDRMDSLVESFIELEPLKPIMNSQTREIQVEKIVQSNIKVTYLHHFLVVDYRDLYTAGIVKEVIQHDVNSGTPVWLEHKNDEVNAVNQDPIVQTVKIPYLEFLKDAQLKYKKNQYKTSLKDYHRILKQYPQDVNALFYGGLCYYNLNKPNRAVQYFDNVINNSVNTFQQEGEFYKALSLLALNKFGQGNGLLQQIIEKGGYYTEQAKEQLNN